jgi:hypothetical protein
MEVSLEGILILVALWAFANAIAEDKGVIVSLMVVPVAVVIIAGLGFAISFAFGLTPAQGIACWFAFSVVMRFAKVISGKND